METAKEKLEGRMLSILDQLYPDGGSSYPGPFPAFDYYALDFLEFAEMNLRRTATSTQTREKENELISCVSNLKRALDCQIECFLSLWGLRDVTRKRNLGLDKKLNFIATIGLVSSRTIGRFTNIRNKIEHEFQRPAVADLEALFDLVTAVVAILQMTNTFNRSVDFCIRSGPDERAGYLNLTYHEDDLKFTARWKLRSDPEESGELEAPFSNRLDFAYFFRVLVLLNQFEGFASVEHIRARLKLSSAPGLEL